MSIFKRNESHGTVYSKEEYEPVLRCSICNGEQVLCLRDKLSGELQELMLIRSPSDLREFCSANGISPDSIRKIY